MPTLFDPFTLKGVTLRNRIAVAPMCQYSADDGVPNAWHQVHLAGLARGGSGLVTVEATAVSPEGRITPKCTGLWNDAQAEAFVPIVLAMKAAGAVPGIQLGHAGRKASANLPWEGDDHIAAGDPRGWETVAPSAIAFGGPLSKVPRAMTQADINQVTADFVAATIRARDSGFEWLMLHFAHGYLAQSFFSAHSNQRDDAYGGDAARRGRFLVETLAAVRRVWPEDRPLSVRFGVIEFDGRDEQTLADSLALIGKFKAEGLDMIDVSLGFSTPEATVPFGPAFMVPYAERVRREIGLPVTCAWMIDLPERADTLVREDKLDMVSLGHPMLENPHWPYRAARELKVPGAAQLLPVQYAHWLARYRS